MRIITVSFYKYTNYASDKILVKHFIYSKGSNFFLGNKYMIILKALT